MGNSLIYRVSELKIPLVQDTPAQLRKAVCTALRISDSQIVSIRPVRRSVDARRKNDVHLSMSAEVTLTRPLRSPLPRNTTIVTPKPYGVPVKKRSHDRPLVVGCGPAGLFAALVLAKAGQAPLLIDRGRSIADRERDVRQFWKTGVLDPNSNVQFGAGGAGAFSDGKLNTGIKDPRIRFVLEEFVRCGAPEQILIDARPHVGTDRLHIAIGTLLEQIQKLGGEIRFETTLTGLDIQNGRLCGVTLTGKDGAREVLSTGTVILAVGHSARDTFTLLHAQGIHLEQKAFAVGARIEHHQSMIDRAQYGEFAGHPSLGAADYRLAVHTPTGQGVYTFCMCPGGTVVAAASEPGMVVTNGMSEFARDRENANAAVLVGISPGEFGSSHPLAGMELQRRLERAAFEAGGGNYLAPAQTVGDFLAGIPSVNFGKIIPSYTRGVTPSDLARCLPGSIVAAMQEGLRQMDRQLHGFAHPEAVLTGVESRSSSPIRMLRGENGHSVSAAGLYPCGEGAGYAGGITSAAVDGIRCAELVLAQLPD